MRISNKYRSVFKKYFLEFFQEGDIYLFGSRVDDSKKGGDIDLYLTVVDHSDLFAKKIKFLARVKRELGDQKIDIVFNTDSTRLIEQEAMQWGVKL
ncbi:MAG: nucleotidyltransferase domain-containing protein [Mariprofundus sp.]|nr:nucleotidyltransferase domain-containing protein [Mariprofundus sp.]